MVLPSEHHVGHFAPRGGILHQGEHFVPGVEHFVPCKTFFRYKTPCVMHFVPPKTFSRHQIGKFDSFGGKRGAFLPKFSTLPIHTETQSKFCSARSRNSGRGLRSTWADKSELLAHPQHFSTEQAFRIRERLIERKDNNWGSTPFKSDAIYARTTCVKPWCHANSRRYTSWRKQGLPSVRVMIICQTT